MRTCWPHLLWPLLLTLALGGQALRAAPLVMVVDQATEMPMSRFQGATLVGGVHFDLGQLLAERLGRELSFHAVPRKRVVEALVRGDGDFVCLYMPAWLSGPLSWSQPFFRQTEVIATRIEVPAPQQFGDLKDQRIGTVNGFVYVELSQALGAHFLREDAPNAGANLRKLAAHRLDHVVVEGRLLAYSLRQGQPPLRLHPRLEVYSISTHCALGPKASIGLTELDRAIERMQQDGSLQALYSSYD